MFHKVAIIGNLGADPELRYMTDGTPVASFNVASNRKWKNKDGSKGEETVWFRISVWRNLAETCNQYLSKGRQVYIEGRLNPDKETGGPRVWTASDGTPRASYEITAFEVKFLSSGGQAGGDFGPSGGAAATTPPANTAEEDIPF